MEPLTAILFLKPNFWFLISLLGVDSWPVVDPNREHRRTPLNWQERSAVCSIAARIVFSRSRSFDRISDDCQVSRTDCGCFSPSNGQIQKHVVLLCFFPNKVRLSDGPHFFFFLCRPIRPCLSMISFPLRKTNSECYFIWFWRNILPLSGLICPYWLGPLVVGSTSRVAMKSICRSAVALFTSNLPPS